MLTISEIMSKSNADERYLNLKDNSFYVYEEKIDENNVSVDLANIPSSLKEALLEIFRLEKDAELIDKEYMYMIEDLLDLTESGELSILIEMIDIAYDSPRKSKEFSDNCLNFIANPKNVKSRALYIKY